MAVKSRREEHTEQTAAAVLSAAKTLFVERSFAATSIDQIAEAARVSKGAVYHHFRDKAELFEALYRAEEQRIMAHVMTAAARHDDPWERLMASIDAYTEASIANADHRALLLQAEEALGHVRCHAMDDDFAIPVLRAWLEPLMEQGVLVRLPIEMLVRVVYSALCEAAMTAAASKDVAAAHAHASLVLRTLCGGLRATPTSRKPAPPPSASTRRRRRAR
jgi:AcrR family transcriptional regulator